MKAYVFPGQGSQKPGMGQDLFNDVEESRELFKKANDILNFNITELMFEGTSEDLLQTKVTQPAIFIHSVISALTSKEFMPDVCAGHSLGEFSALVATKSVSFEDGLKLVSIRANAMQRACQETKGTMAAILGLSDDIVESACNEIDGIVKPANYNCPGQLVIYFILNMKNLPFSPTKLTSNILKNTLEVLESFGLKSNIQENDPGIFIDGKKVASIGMRIKKNYSYHGLSVNINTDLHTFNTIKPCGLEVQACNLKDYINIKDLELKDKLLAKFKTTLIK